MSGSRTPLLPNLPIVLALALALALAALGLGHRAGPTRPDPQLAAYLAAGGVLSDLCAGHDTGAAHAHDKSGNGCAACRLAGAAPLPGAGTAPALPNAPARLLAAVPGSRLAAGFLRDPGRVVRAPPLA